MTLVADVNVSRETKEKMDAFADLVLKWTPKINLISTASVKELWPRHIQDSAQIFDLAPPEGSWLDIGSGGGFPAIVAAILSNGAHTFILIESDQRKCAFLRTASRELDLNLTVLSERIETVSPVSADILTARALADLTLLLSFTERHLAPNGCAFFPKGATWEKEVVQSQDRWSYAYEAITSKTNPSAAILKIQDLNRV